MDKIRETAVKFRHCSPELTAVALIIVAAVVLLSPVLETPFYGDDLHNIQRSAELAAEDQTSWAFIASQNQQWMTNEGRFFPVTFTEITLLFDNVHARWIYKTLQMVAATGAVAVLGTFVAVLSRNRRLGLLVSIVALSGLQIRLWYDPIISYNLMLPSLTITILLSWLILVGGLRSSNRTLTITAFACSGLLWTVGLLQYEITYLLAPAVLAILWHERLTERWRLWAAGGTVLIPTFLLANYVATLRSGATPSPAYTTNFALEDVVPAAIYQLVGAFPGTAAVFAAGVPGIGSLIGRTTLWSLLGAIAGGGAVYLLLRHPWRPPTRSATALTGLGIALFVLPAIPISLSLRWQAELDWGLAYVPVFIQTLGLAMLVVGSGSLIVLAARRVTAEGLVPELPGWATRGAPLLAALVVGGALLVTSNGNRWVAEQLSGFRVQQETTDAAIATGFLDLIEDESLVVVSRLPGGNEFYNDAYVSWRGGPTGVTYLTEVPTDATSCGTFLLCGPEGRSLYHLKEILTPSGDLLVSVARIADHTADASDPLVLLDEAAVFGPRALTRTCSVSGSASLQETGRWVQRLCDGPPVAASLLTGWMTSIAGTELSTAAHLATDAAIADGFFDRVEHGATIVTGQGGHHSRAYFEWLGGPTGLSFTTSLPAGTVQCGEAQLCTDDNSPIFFLRDLPAGDEMVLLLTPAAGDLGNPTDPLIIMGHATLFGRNDATPLCVMEDDDAGSVPETGTDWISRICTGPPTSLSSFETWVASGCTEGLMGWFICVDAKSRD